MSYGSFLIRQPLFWALLAGAFAGAAAGSAIRPRSRSLTAALLLLSAAVVSAAAGLILPPPGAALTVEALSVLVAALVLAVLGACFPRAAGIPLLLLGSGLGLAAVFLLRPWYPVRGETVVAAYRLLSMDERSLVIELRDGTSGAADPVPAIMTVPGPSVEFSLEVLDLTPYAFLTGADRFVRLLAPRHDQAVPEPGRADPPAFLVRSGLASVSALAAVSEPANLLRTYEVVLSTGEPSVRLLSDP